MIQNQEQWGCCSEHFWWCAGAENWVRGIRFRGEMEGEELGHLILTPLEYLAMGIKWPTPDASREKGGQGQWFTPVF